MRFKALIALAGVCVWPIGATALDTPPLSLKTTEDLYHVCTPAPDDPQRREALDLCEGFLIGAVSYHDAVSDREHLKRLICYPTTVTRDEGVAAFVAWAQSHQQDGKFMSDPPVYGVVRGLASKWPCNERVQRGNVR